MRFFSILKPGIIFGNLITVCGGFFLGSTHVDWKLLFFTIIGMALIVGSGCVFNNIIDRDIDQLMERTCDRVLVKGLVSWPVALLYGVILGLLGFIVLYRTTNPIAVWIAGIGWIVYVIIYSIIFKRQSTLGTTLGGISGAVPPVVGYCAATGQLDWGALLLFLILFFWQMPHFYAISIYRQKDFKAAGIPILPLIKGMAYTKKSAVAYIIAFTIVAVLPSVLGYAGWAYGVVALCIGLFWLYIGIKGFKATDDRIWARKLFGFSILGITILSFMMIVK